MSSATVFTDVANGLAAVIDAAAITLLGNSLKVYTYAPRDIDRRPAVTIEGPMEFDRRGPDEAESQLGSFDWHLTYKLTIWVDLDEPQTAQEGMRSVLGQVIAAIDAAPTLGGTVLVEATIARGAQSYTTPSADSPSPQMIVHECDLLVWTLST